MMKRIVWLDVCRGLMLLMMTFNHLMVLPFLQIEWLYWSMISLAYGALGIISNSEGFFCLAGVVAGLVYSKKLMRGESLWPRVLGRIRLMFLVQVILGLVIMFFSLCPHYLDCFYDLHTKVNIWIDQPGVKYYLANPVRGFLMGLVFLYNMPFMDILPVYMVFMVIIPVVLNLFEKGHMGRVLFVSWLMWLSAQFMGFNMVETWASRVLGIPLLLGWFNLLAIQLVFVVGLSFGYAFAKGVKIEVRSVVGAVLVTLIASALILKGCGISLEGAHHLGLVRLCTFCLKVALLYLVRDWLKWEWLARIGRHSLWVFSYHIALVYVWIFALPFLGRVPDVVAVVLLVASIGSIALPAWWQEKRVFNKVVSS